MHLFRSMSSCFDNSNPMLVLVFLSKIELDALWQECPGQIAGPQGLKANLLPALQAAKEGVEAKEKQLAELQAQLTAAEEAAATHKKQALATRGELFSIRTSTKKTEKTLTEENNKMKGELAHVKSLNETIRTSSQNVRVQLETAKVCKCNP